MSYKKDINGEVVITKLNKNYLENISDKTKGKYIDGSVTENVINEVIEILENTEKKNLIHKNFLNLKTNFSGLS